jgi:hypothetical protein
VRGNQAVLGITGSVATFGEASLVTGLLQIQIENVALLFLSLSVHPFCLEGGLDRQRFYSVEQLARKPSRRCGDRQSSCAEASPSSGSVYCINRRVGFVGCRFKRHSIADHTVGRPGDPTTAPGRLGPICRRRRSHNC